MINRILLVFILLAIIFFFSQMMIKSSSEKIDQPEYTVLKKFDEFEIREYPSLYVAKTKMNTSGYDGNSSEGFRTIAGYIFGGNEKQQKIAMTSPVIMDMSDSVEMAFIMPENITPDNAPSPNNSRVKLVERPSQTLAVLRFSGWANSSKIAAKEKYLIQLLEDNNIEYEGDVIYMGYNPPFQIVDRRNEVAIKVKL